MSDFAIVRLELATDIHSDPDEAIAALDRIEDTTHNIVAENARLREALKEVIRGIEEEGYTAWAKRLYADLEETPEYYNPQGDVPWGCDL